MDWIAREEACASNDMERTRRTQLAEVLPWSKRRRSILVAAPVVVTLAVTMIVFTCLRQSEQASLEVAFEVQTGSTFSGLRENFRVYRDTVQSISSSYSASEQVGPVEFNAFVARKLAKYDGIQALEWIPRVPRPERAA